MKKQFTAEDKLVLAKQAKDFMNIIYGKSVTKEIEE